jgi:hypothetical protein
MQFILTGSMEAFGVVVLIMEKIMGLDGKPPVPLKGKLRVKGLYLFGIILMLKWQI